MATDAVSVPQTAHTPGRTWLAANAFFAILERDLMVTLREFVPSATLTLHTVDGDVVAGSMLPGAATALHRQDGEIWVGLQVQHDYGDASRDLAAAIEAARAVGPGDVAGVTSAPGEGPRLQDLVTGVGEVTVHDGFDWWVGVDLDEAMRHALDEANAMVAPTVRLPGVEAAYWTRVGEGDGTREFLRWAMPEDEEPLLDSLARLHQRGETVLVDGARMIGMFRALGVLVPVWSLPEGTGADALTEPAARFREALVADLAEGGELSSEARATRAGLASRQVTLR